MLHDPDFHPHRTLNYTLAALLGVLAGFIIGYVFAQAPSLEPSRHRPTTLIP